VKSTGVTQPTDKVRLGRLTECDQPHNSIVLNASNIKIDNIEHSGFYVSPIRCTEASNLLAYNSITKEIVDIGGQKLKISSLEVENLDVVNSNVVHNYYVDNPIFEIAKGKPIHSQDVGIVMHRGGGNVDIKFSEKNNHLAINKNLAVDGIIKAKIFEGDAGLLSNVQFDFKVGDTFENLTIIKDLRADGSLLSNISIHQLKDLKTTSLDLLNVYMDGTLRVKKTIYSQSSIIAPSFIGDGRKLEGIALKEDVDTNTKQIYEIKQILPNIERIENEIKRVESIIPTLDPLELKIQAVENNIPCLKPLDTRIGELEKYSCYVKEKFKTIEKEIKDNIPEKIDLTYIEQNIAKLKSELDKLSDIEKSINPKIQQLRKDISRIPIVPNLTQNVIDINSKIDILNDVFNKSLDLTKSNINKSINIWNKNIENGITNLENNIQDTKKNIAYIETFISNIHNTESEIIVLKECTPKLDSRIQTLEDYVPPIHTLQSITSCGSNTECSITLENKSTSLTTFGNVGIGTSAPSSRISIYNDPNITSVLGEVDAIKINELAQINAYTKANAGLSSGRPGGLIFKTKRPNGTLQDSMTIDGNGSVTIGSSTANTSAALSINSTTRGLLLPRMTTEQIENIKNPEPGLIIYDTEKDTFVGYRKSGWSNFC